MGHSRNCCGIGKKWCDEATNEEEKHGEDVIQSIKADFKSQVAQFLANRKSYGEHEFACRMRHEHTMCELACP